MLVNPREEKAGFDSEAGALIRSEISTVKSGHDLVLLKSEDRGVGNGMILDHDQSTIIFLRPDCRDHGVCFVSKLRCVSHTQTLLRWYIKGCQSMFGDQF